MKGWILFHRDLDPAIPEVPEVLRFQEAAAGSGIALEVYKPQLFDLVVGASEDWALRYEGRPVERPDFVICRSGSETDYATLALLRQLERRGVRLINGSATIELVSDKLHTMQKLARAGLPVPPTILGKFPIDPRFVEQELGFPVIVKTLKGTRGAGVLKCEDRAQFEDLAGLLESANAQADFILQHYIRASHGRDVRVLVVGGRVVAAMERRSLTGGFKSNVSLGGVGVAYNPPAEMAELAVRAADALGLDVTGIDILFDEEGYRICEANSAPGFQGLERATGLDIPGIILGWVVATQPKAMKPLAPDEQEVVLTELVFGGRARLRALVDASPTYWRFARMAGWRLIAAGLTSFLHGALPSVAIGSGDRTGPRLRAVYEDRSVSVTRLSEDREQERTLLTILSVSIWAAVLPWLSGADPRVSGSLSFIALTFPLIFLLTTRPDAARRRSPQPKGLDPR